MSGPNLLAFLLTTIVAAAVGAAVGVLGAWMTEVPAAPPAPVPRPVPAVEAHIPRPDLDGVIFEKGTGCLGISVAFLARAQDDRPAQDSWSGMEVDRGARACAVVLAAQVKYRGLPEGMLRRVLLLEPPAASSSGEALPGPPPWTITPGEVVLPIPYGRWLLWMKSDIAENAFHREIGRRVFDRIAATPAGRRWSELHDASQSVLPDILARHGTTLAFNDDHLISAGFVDWNAMASPREDFAAFHAAAWTWGGKLSECLSRPRRKWCARADSRFALLEEIERDLGLLGPDETLRWELPMYRLPWLTDFDPTHRTERTPRIAYVRRAVARREPLYLR